MFPHPLLFRDPQIKLRFEAHYQTYLDQLKAQRPNVVVVAKRDPLSFLAALLASMQYQKVTLVADPYWQSLEWEALFETIAADWVFSDSPIFLPSPPDRKTDYTPWHSYVLLPTGGSSGKLKLCIHSMENFRKSTEATASFLGQKQLDTLSFLPPWHISGLMPFLRAYFTGGSYTFVDPKALSLAQLPMLYEERSKLESKAVFTSLVPTLLKRILEEDALCTYFKAFRGIFVGGAPLLGPIFQAALDKALPILPTYGSTETASMISLHPLDTPLPSQPGYSGTLLPHATLILEGQPPLGTSFHLNLSCESLFYGYFPARPHRPQAFQTQDLARLENKEQLYIEGRQDRILISGGKKIDPLEVETALLKTQAIQDCIAFSVPHLEWGEALALAYISKMPVSPEALKQSLKPLLAPYKMPKIWYPVSTLPFNDRGKLNAKTLEHFIQSLPPPFYT